MAEESIMVRVGESLKKRLDGVRQRLVDAARKRPHTANPKLLGGIVSYADVIEELTGRYLTQVDRNRYYQQKLRQLVAEEAKKRPQAVQEEKWPDDVTYTITPEGEIARMEYEGNQQFPKEGD